MWEGITTRATYDTDKIYGVDMRLVAAVGALVAVAAVLWLVVLDRVQGPSSAPALALSCPARLADRIAIGFTLSHTSLSPGAASECTEQNKLTLVTPASNIIGHYQDSAIRTLARQDLATMHNEGARWVRDIVWFRLAEDPASKKDDQLGMLTATDGTLPLPDVSNLVAYAKDVRAAGFERMVVVLGVQGRANPKCNDAGGHGGCYESAYNAHAWSVAEQVIRAMKTANLSGLNVVFDIAPEQCFVASSANAPNLKQYATYMITHYTETFGDDHQWIMSCPTGTNLGKNFVTYRTQEIEDTTAFWHSLDVVPAYVDVHMYFDDRVTLDALLTAYGAAAASMHTPLVVGETGVDNTALFNEASKLVADGELNNLAAILIWPKMTNSLCGMDVAPPYNIDAVNTALGRAVKSAGASLVGCSD